MRDMNSPMPYALCCWVPVGWPCLVCWRRVTMPPAAATVRSGTAAEGPPVSSTARCAAPRAAVTSGSQAKAGRETAPLDPSGQQMHSSRRSLVPWNMVEHLPWLPLQYPVYGFQHAQVQQRVLVIGQLADGVDVQPGLARQLLPTHPTFVS